MRIVISICCVDVASLDVVCDEHNDCAWNVGVYVYCVERFAHIDCYSDCSRSGRYFVMLCVVS